ncbi:MAG: FeoC-like transcriptional regulator [Victivallales bacterium]
MLREMRNYIRDNREVAVKDVAIRFRADKSLIEALAKELEDKGFVEVRRPGTCSGCSGSCECSSADNGVMLKWKDR